jgi:glycosyltransferase involved in cell wall biosynthesis
VVRVLHLISSLDVGGAELSLLRLVCGMDEKRFENHVVSLIPAGAVGARIRSLGVRVDSLAMRRGRASPVAVMRLVRLLRHERPDVLQTWLYHADLLGLIAGYMAGQGCVVWNVRSSDMDMAHYRWLSGATVRACAHLSRLPQAVVVNSEAGRHFHEGVGYRPRRWVVIRNGLDTTEFRPDPAARRALRAEIGGGAEGVLIGLVARYDPMKDHRTFLQAAGILVRGGVNAHFVLAGDGVVAQNSNLGMLVREEGLVGRVYPMGRRDDVSRLLAGLDIVALSSVFGEGFPNVVAEAMACGVPCVVTDVGDAAAIVANTGLVVPRQSPEALAAALLEFVAMNSEERQRLGRLARARVEREFSLERMVSAYEDLYVSLVGCGPAAGP